MLSDIGTSVDVVINDGSVVVTAVGTVEAVDPTRSYAKFYLGHHSSHSNYYVNPCLFRIIRDSSLPEIRTSPCFNTIAIPNTMVAAGYFLILKIAT